MKKINQKIFLIIALLVLIPLVAAFVSSKNNKTKLENKTFDPRVYIAVVNDEGIKREDYKKRQGQRSYFKKWLIEHNTTSTVLTKSVLETMIEETLSLKFAQENNLIPSQKEVERKYFAAVKSVGTEEQYLTRIKDLQGQNKDNILKQMEFEIIQTKIEKKTKMPYSVWIKEQKIKAEIEKYD
ncbi:MAG: hypothetical protein A3G66_01000 [Candidatus Levybacteria bacterium RIFCSPLOWO2_12_FULL_39_17]|uniref:PpiC-type peptidyl-prolyl cis-trans isomerase n=1 Tax=Candidatus Woesebacteria bacterium GW2011_GWA1_41_13b TaxID=1618555 RepID=A0A0G0X552_9BACT|nr:MAG: hypothetical protein UU42_C0007G0002 [Candidatus Woesebacteria bacterium GW2011_GWA1_41_13b]OGH14555.1 MAG: hypothetical protein A2689_01200 [Candidatus Levybacteria bacterium RIFCSPHIGHO2_01_FULL_38_96]OGH48005.1 MAG: hypothetical protein A3G66_01000 [Candidatus Levybacteria bacterium RIFCSPLOWO2_12_FULL_39_17]